MSYMYESYRSYRGSLHLTRHFTGKVDAFFAAQVQDGAFGPHVFTKSYIEDI